MVKADGLAAGKGVVVAASIAEAEQAASAMLQEAQFEEAGCAIVIEEFLEGWEASFICLVDGTDVIPLATSQDHKARDEGNRGPNTGGMGAYSPTPLITPELHRRVLEEVIHPTVRGLASGGNPVPGFSICRAHAGLGGQPESARIQLPVRRSRDPSRSCSG